MTSTATDYCRAVEQGNNGLAEWIGAQLDAAGELEAAWSERPDALALAAESYARRGLAVFPLATGSKLPLSGRMTCCGGSHRRGCTDALADPAAARAWWREHPTANIGLATGGLFDVIDQDGAVGAVTWARGQWPAVLGVVSTPRAGGVHRYVLATGRSNGQAIFPGIDYRGRGGYVLAPPSIVDGRRYTWLQPLPRAAG